MAAGDTDSKLRSLTRTWCDFWGYSPSQKEVEEGHKGPRPAGVNRPVPETLTEKKMRKGEEKKEEEDMNFGEWRRTGRRESRSEDAGRF